MSNSLVSILLVTWNRKEELARSLDSAIAQTYGNIEIVVVDNASTDGTAGFVRKQYPDVRLIESHRNLGCPSGRNLGMANCRGEYIYSLDDDGWLEPDAVEKAVEMADREPSLGAVMSIIKETQGNRLFKIRPEGLKESVYLGSFSGGCILLRQRALEDVGYFPDDFVRQGEEEDMALRMLDRGWAIRLQPESVMYHKPSPVGRSVRTFRYYTLRNGVKTALRLWPFPWSHLRVLSLLRRAFVAAVRHGWLLLPWQILGCSVRELWCSLWHRKPISIQAYKAFRQLRERPSKQSPLEWMGRTQATEHVEQ
jgi:GT2 family glycosyltransferase